MENSGSRGSNNGFQDKLVIAVIVLLLIGGGVWRSGFFSKPAPEIMLESPSEESFAEPAEIELITVHLVGAVNEPGIYKLPEGSRVYELLALCGGLCDDADREALNQARPLFDGEQVVVQRIGEAPVSREGGAAGKININTASASELTALPGIGDVRAAQIVAHREKYGFFKDIREIMDISGIGSKTFENIAELITIY